MKKLVFILLLLVGLGIYFVKTVSPLGISIDELLQNQLVTHVGRESQKSFNHNKYIYLYFGDSKSRESLRFTKQLLEFYREMKKADNFDVIYISSDSTEKRMHQVMQRYQMPWNGVKFDSPAKQRLIKAYKVNKFPALLFIDPSGLILEQGGTEKTHNTAEDALAESKTYLSRYEKELLEKSQEPLDVEVAQKTAPPTKQSEEKLSFWQSAFSPQKSEKVLNMRKHFKISGLMTSGSDRKAILNGKVVSIGDVVKKEFRILDITDEGVTLSYKEHTALVPMK